MDGSGFSSDLFWIIADAHLSAGDKTAASKFEGFLDLFEKDGPRRLMVLGDLFSSWIAMNNALSDYEKGVLLRFYKLKNRGKEVVFITGNRDYYVEELTSEPFVFTGEAFREKLPSGRTVQFEHGDTINLDDRNYLAWRGVSRSGAVRALMGVLPAGVVKKVRSGLEEKLAETNPNYRIDLPVEHLGKYAAALREEGVDILVLGHFHREQRLALGGVDVRILPRFAPKGEFCRITANEEILIQNLEIASNE